ncbi:hypothetical protein Tco_1555425, partial [Tanacetum coccineum]
SLEAEVLVRSTNQPQTSYAVAASLSEFELKKILIDKMETNKSIDRSDTLKNLYNALVDSYNTNNDIITLYGDVVTLKRGRDDQDKDEDPSAGSNRGSKRRRSGKEAESSKEQKNKEFMSISSSKSASKSQPKYLGKSTHAEEHDQKAADLEDQPQQEFNIGNEDKSLVREALNEDVWHKNPSRPPTPDLKLEYHLEEVFKATNDQLDWHNPKGKPYPHDLSKPLPLILNEQGYQVIPLDHFINNDLEYLKGGSSSKKYTTSTTKTKATDYGQVKWIEDKVQNVINSTDMLPTWKHQNMSTPDTGLLYINLDKLTDLHLEERYALNVALRMFTRRIVIQERVEDLQFGVKSYQKKISFKKPYTYRSNLKRMTSYTAYPNIQGIIYEDEMNRNRLMRTDELQKFNDGTLNHVLTALNDIALGIKMDYLPKRKWSKQDRQRARVMINAIDKKLKDRRLMRSLEKFVGGRPCGGDLRLLERTLDLSYAILIS